MEIVFIVWSVILILCSVRLWRISQDLERQQTEFRRWLRRHDEKNNRQRI